MRAGRREGRPQRPSARRGLLLLGGLLALLMSLTLSWAGQALASGITNSGDDLRDGWYPEQSSLTPQLVSGGTFGQLWSTAVEGEVYAQPLLSNGTLLVASSVPLVSVPLVIVIELIVSEKPPRLSVPPLIVVALAALKALLALPCAVPPLIVVVPV